MAVLIQQIQATHSYTIHVLFILSLCFASVIITIYAHENNMGLEVHLVFSSFQMLASNSFLWGKYFFFLKTNLFTYLFFIRNGYSSHDANLLGNLSCSRNISAVIRNADGICVSHKMFSYCSVK